MVPVNKGFMVELIQMLSEQSVPSGFFVLMFVYLSGTSTACKPLSTQLSKAVKVYTGINTGTMGE
jgi:CHASE1-domain containing sensor protein